MNFHIEMSHYTYMDIRKLGKCQIMGLSEHSMSRSRRCSREASPGYEAYDELSFSQSPDLCQPDYLITE